MFKLITFAALFAFAFARPSYLASSPVIYSSHYVQPVVRSHYAVPVLRTVATPLIHTLSAPVVHSISTPIIRTEQFSTPLVQAVATPVIHASSLHHSYSAFPALQSYTNAYGAFKNKSKK